MIGDLYLVFLLVKSEQIDVMPVAIPASVDCKRIVRAFDFQIQLIKLHG